MLLNWIDIGRRANRVEQDRRDRRQRQRLDGEDDEMRTKVRRQRYALQSQQLANAVLLLFNQRHDDGDGELRVVLRSFRCCFAAKKH